MWVTKAEALAMTAPLPDDSPLAGLPVVRTAAFRDLITGRTIVMGGRFLDAVEELAAKGEARRD